MRKVLFAAVGLAAFAGAAGLAAAQQNEPRDRQFGIFQADANNDGVVTRQEFDAWRAARFDRLDANNDGVLSREELRAGRGERAHGHRGMRLDRMDANNDGVITREEFLAGPNRMFDRLDANNDGVISADERPQRGERRQRGERANPDANGDRQLTRAEYMAMGARMFERLDANNDGRVTREEVQAARQQRRGR